MADLDPIPSFGKKIAQDFSDTLGKEKHIRIAHDAVRDLMLFNNALETEVQSMMVAAQKGARLDQKLLDKMTIVKEKYNYAMSGFKAFDDDMQRYALTALADAIQDLMFYLHNKRKH